jgi:hypothetical protein
VYGCSYNPDVLHFNGASFLRRNLTSAPVTSLKEFVQEPIS